MTLPNKRKPVRKTAKDYEAEQFWKVFIMGDVGTGKSVFAATFPRPMYVFNFDSRIQTYLEDKPDELTYSDYGVTGKDWAAFETELRIVAKEAEEGKYKTIVADSTSTMNALALARSMQIDPKRSAIGGAIWNVHFQMRKDLVESKLNAIRLLPANIVLAGHLQAVYDSEGNLINFEPLLGGQAKISVPANFDEIFITMVKTVKGKPKYIARTAPKGMYAARSTFSGVKGRLPLEIPNNYNELLKYKTKEEKTQ